MSRFERSLLLAVLLVAWALPVPARASTIYPPELQDYWELPSLPVCTTCHTSLSGGYGTATQPFAVSLKERGLGVANPESLYAALDQMERDEVDSDGDGATDYDELREGDDPNHVAEPIDAPRYGCGARVVATTAPPRLAPWLLVLGLLGLSGLRSRRSR